MSFCQPNSWRSTGDLKPAGGKFPRSRGLSKRRLAVVGLHSILPALYEAVEAKLTEQRKFVLWWDAEGLRKGGKPSQTSDGMQTAENFGLDRDTIHRWRYRARLAEIKLSSSSFQNFVP